MAPEILSRKTYGRQADIWSMGVLFYCLLYGDFPFKGIDILDEIKTRCTSGYKLNDLLKVKGLKNKKEEALLLDFFERIFEMEPQKRITMNEILSHDLMSQGE